MLQAAEETSTLLDVFTDVSYAKAMDVKLSTSQVKVSASIKGRVSPRGHSPTTSAPAPCDLRQGTGLDSHVLSY